MKILVFSFIFACLVFPVFSQNASTERFRALDDSMGTTISNSNDKLRDFDDQMNDNGNAKTYAAYRDRYQIISRALRESELKLTRLIQFNDRPTNLKAERDNYASLIRRLEAVKSEYDDWLRTVQ